MKTTIITIMLAGISSIALSQEIQKGDSTSMNISISETPVEVTELHAPLYILDNKEIAYKDINTINTDHIQSITVLRDSSAVAKYGERGSKGVVILESKNPRLLSTHKKRSTIE